MILMTTYHIGQVPFKNVYLHGLVRDANKKKMSKSLGNVIDPLDMITKYGTDAVRFALIFNTAPGTDMALAEDKIKGMKHFANKLWNIARYILANVSSTEYSVLSTKAPAPLTDADKEVLNKLEALTKETTEHIEKFRLHEAAQALYQFTWHELADVYIEASKTQLQNETTTENTQAILLYSLFTILKLIHPFMPFITEEIWSKLHQEKLLLVAPWPK
jgi:valyl-tRNA synthetase